MAAVRRQGGRRTLVLTTGSTPRFCRVCDDARAVAVVRLLDPAIAGSGRSRCPHCSPCRSQGEMALPIYDYVLRDERPRGDAA